MARNNQTKDQSTTTKPPTYIAWNVNEKGDDAFWTRIGGAFAHKDGKGLTLHLDMLPINGRIILREPFREELRPVEASD